MRQGLPGRPCVDAAVLQLGLRGFCWISLLLAGAALCAHVAIAQATPELQASPTAIQPQTHPMVQVRQAKGPIAIDGKLNEPDWQSAQTLVLTQQSPRPGQPTPYKTEVKVLIYHDALIFGFHCFDPNPKAIQAHSLERDAPAFGDDLVAITPSR
jgi:hypothetical protein